MVPLSGRPRHAWREIPDKKRGARTTLDSKSN
jgi:hypothetical protein